MPNTSVSVKFAGKYCVVPNPRDPYYAEAIYKANRFLCPVGPEPGIGYLLVLRSDWDSINSGKNSPQKLEINAPAGGSNSSGSLVLPALYIISAQQLTGGKPGDLSSVYMVKVTDKRWIARMSSITLQVNMRVPAPPRYGGTPTNEYYQGSLNSGATYAWTDFVSAIWATMPILGSFPGLPYVPNGIPENYNFLGVNAYDALNGVLERLGCVLVYDPMADVFFVQQLGIAQAGLSAALNGAQNFIMDDIAPFDVGATLAPETIRVLFNDWENHYGTQVDTNPASGITGNWLTGPPITEVDTASNIPGAVSGTILQIWDDFPAIYDFDGTYLNTSDVNARAAERVANWTADYNLSMPRRRTVYTGMQTKFVPGSQLKYVYWRADGAGDGATTEVGCYPGLAMITDQAGDLSCLPVVENVLTPDLSRKTYPVYPHVCQWITIIGSSGGITAGTSVSPTVGGLFEGQVTRIDPRATTTTEAPYNLGEKCWVLVTDKTTGSSSSTPKLVVGERYLGRLNGSFSNGSDGRPMYVIDKDSQLKRFELTAALAFGTAPTGNNARPLNWNGTDWVVATSGDFTVWDPFFQTGGVSGYSAFTGKGPLSGQPGYQGWCMLASDSGRYEIVYLEGRARSIAFTLTADMAKVSGLNQSAAATVTDFYLGRDPDPAAAGITIFDPQNLFLHALNGAKGIARYSDENDRYEVVESITKAGEIAVTLSADMSSGSASATLANSAGQAGAWGTQQDQQAPTGTITVRDPFGSSGPFSIARSGAKAIAIYDELNDKYWLIECERLALLFTATLSAALSGTSTASVGTLTPASQWPFTQAPASTPTVNNPRGHYASSGDNVLIYRDGTTYNICDVQQHQKNFLTGWSISGSNIVVTTSANVAVEWDGTTDTTANTATGSC